MTKTLTEFEKIPTSWRIATFEEVAELKHGYQFRTPDFTESGIKVFKITQIKSNGTIDISNCDFIASERVRDFERVILKRGDILMALTGATIGKIARYDEDVTALQNYRVGNFIPLDDKVLSKDYFYYFLSSSYFFNQVLARQTQSAQQNIGKEEINKMQIILPPIDQQFTIANTLNSLDRKIKNNTQTNQTLESIAQAIFKSWFVDFEPVKAKMAALAEGGTREQAELAAMGAISGKSEAELAQLQQQNPEHYQKLAETAALFPSAMVESELGEIPEGWEVKSISDISIFPNGKIDTNALSLSNYISTENMLENRGGISEAASLPSTSTVPQFSPNQILISNIRPYFKKIWLARFSGGRSNDVLAFAAKESGNAEFLYNLLYQDSFFEFMTRTSKGAKMPRGDKNAISNWKFACAPILLRSHFSKEVRSMYSKIQNANNQNIELAELRDSLLPKLLSGEIDLSDIQSEVA